MTILTAPPSAPRSFGPMRRGQTRPVLRVGRVVARYVGVAALVAAVALEAALVPSMRVTRRSPAAQPTAALGPPVVAGSSGLTVGGIECRPGVRQVRWSHYAPLCLPAWHGRNGGSTARGVTATTITITYREAVSTEDATLLSHVASSDVGTNAEVEQMMRTYIGLFNRTFELYGRHVVLRVFRGQGDFLEEDLGADQSEAQADAQTAASLGAFADVSLLASTTPYDEALAEDHVIAIGAQYMPQSFFERFAPYEYSPLPDCDKVATAAAAVLGRGMAGLPAIYAGSASLRSRIRVFGLLYPQSPSYTSCMRTATSVLEQRFHVRLAAAVGYSFDLSTLQSEAQTAIAQLKSAGVTTVLCACDPITPIFLAQAADAQHYEPEWFTLSLTDWLSRLPSTTQWSHALSGGIVTVPRNEQEAYQAYLLASGGKPPPADSYIAVYEPLLMLFDALQAAGPDLTPQTFERGMQSLPPSLRGGMFGAWRFGPNTFDPAWDFEILWWSPTAPSGQDGLPGSWQACNGGQRYPYDPAGIAALLPKGRQLACFGRS
jgi:hypothetical protein